MEKVNFVLVMGINIMVIGKIIILMERGNLAGLMGINTMEIGEVGESMDMVLFIIQMEIYTKENGLMI